MSTPAALMATMAAMLLAFARATASGTGDVGLCASSGPKLTRVGGAFANTPNAGLESAAYDQDSKLWFATVVQGGGLKTYRYRDIVSMSVCVVSCRD